MILVLFSDSYPFDQAAEQPFLDHEIPFLVKSFDRVILVPRRRRNAVVSAPPGVEVEDGLIKAFRIKPRLIRLVRKAIKSSHFYNEILEHPLLLLKPVNFLRLLLFSGRAEIVKNWLESWMMDRQIKPDNVILYGYWFDDTVMGLGLVKNKYPKIKLVSRAHGYDIYEELYFPYYWPLRRQVLASLDKLFLSSYDGRDYFYNHFPEFHELFETSHLGVEDPGYISKPSTDGTFRIVSCAYIVPLKRIDLLLKSIAYVARIHSGLKFEWHHFGDGKERRKLLKAVNDTFPPNAKGYLPGHVPNRDILQHYKENPVDVFVNLSTTEGGAPVSIMEAISCGIPIIATKVGGNPEIVSGRNGLLLSSDPTLEEVAMALLQIQDSPKPTIRKMKDESRNVWQENFNAENNYRTFASKLASIGKG